ncbi:MAG: hypothetical protein WKF71_01150 [Pyrinomonadaceae bacterium]
MQTEIAETIYEKVKILPLDKQKEVLIFVEKKLFSAEKKIRVRFGKWRG